MVAQDEEKQSDNEQIFLAIQEEAKCLKNAVDLDTNLKSNCNCRQGSLAPFTSIMLIQKMVSSQPSGLM